MLFVFRKNIDNYLDKKEKQFFTWLKKYPKTRLFILRTRFKIFGVCGGNDSGHYPIFGAGSSWVQYRKVGNKCFFKCQICGEKTTSTESSGGKGDVFKTTYVAEDIKTGELVEMNAYGKPVGKAHHQYERDPRGYKRAGKKVREYDRYGKHQSQW
jgi:hypothetical protein